MAVQNLAEVLKTRKKNTMNLVVGDSGKIRRVPMLLDPLEGKNSLLGGDSIVYGEGWKGGWVNLILENHDCTVVNCARSGATLADKWIGSLIQKEGLVDMPKPDYLILDGGGNDILSNCDFGTYDEFTFSSSSSAFNTATTLGALEELFFSMGKYYPETKIIYIIVYKNLWGNDITLDVWAEKYNLIKGMCRKYSIPIVDYFNESNLIISDKIYELYMHDSLHINEAGYRRLYPLLENTLMRA